MCQCSSEIAKPLLADAEFKDIASAMQKSSIGANRYIDPPVKYFRRSSLCFCEEMDGNVEQMVSSLSMVGRQM